MTLADEISTLALQPTQNGWKTHKTDRTIILKRGTSQCRASNHLVEREQATVHARVQEKRSRLRRVVLDQVAFFNILLKISQAANRGDARSKARDIGDSANDCMDTFVDVVAHHRRSLKSFAFHQHGITIRKVLWKIVQY